MTIRQLIRNGSIALLMLWGLGSMLVAWNMNEIRIGGSMQQNNQLVSDLVADILPPPEYVVEAYLEATLIINDPQSFTPHAERLKQLQAEYEARHAFWLTAELPSGLKRLMVQTSYAPAARFWKEVNNGLLPAARSGDAAALRASYASLSREYKAHRAAIDATVQTALKYQGELGHKSNMLLMTALLLLCGFAALFVVAVAAALITLYRRVVNPIQSTAKAMHGMAKGDLDIAIEGGDRADEIGEMARALDALRKAAQQKTQLEAAVATATTNIRTGSAEISAASNDLARRTELQAASLDQTAIVMENLAASVRETAGSAATVSQSVNVTQDDAIEGGKVVREAVDAMGLIEKSSQEISQIINVIDGIAFQTNLLALNAGVEAARAGDAGRGFAVVANEVRALAQRSAEAAKHIKELITNSSHAVNGGVQLVRRTGETLGRIEVQIVEISTLVNQIAEAADEQATGLHQINNTIGDMGRTTSQNAAMVEEATAAALSLVQQTNQLNELVRAFHTSEAQPGPKSQAVVEPEMTEGRPARKPARHGTRNPVHGNLALALDRQDEDWEEF